MKRIGIFADDFYPPIGGQGKHLIHLYNFLYKKSSKFLIFSPNKNKLKNHVQIFKEKKIVRNLQFSLYLTININKIVHKYKLSTIHLHCGPGGIILLRKPNLKMICTVHHTYYQQQKYLLGQKFKYFLYLLEKKMYKNADILIAVSEDTRDTLIKNYNIPQKKIIVIPNGADTDTFKRIDKIKKIESSILFVGRLEKRKGIEFLIKTIPLVKKRIPDIKLFVIGKGKLKEKLEKIVKQSNLKDNVIFLGFVSDKDIPKWYNCCRLTIVPSVFEGFGITIIESLACGTPVIGTNAEGIRRIINNKNWLVEYKNYNDLANKIVAFFKNKDLNYSFPSLKKYNWSRIAHETKKIYRY